MTLESKVRIYKTMVRPILTYATETRAETMKTKQKMRTADIKILRLIVGVSLTDKQKHKREMQDIVKSKVRKRQWNDYVNRMKEIRLAFIRADDQEERDRDEYSKDGYRAGSPLNRPDRKT